MQKISDLLSGPIGSTVILSIAMIAALRLLVSGDAHVRGVAAMAICFTVAGVAYFVPVEPSLAAMWGLALIIALLGMQRLSRAFELRSRRRYRDVQPSEDLGSQQTPDAAKRGV